MDRIPMQVRPDGPVPRDHGHAPGFNGSAMASRRTPADVDLVPVR